MKIGVISDTHNFFDLQIPRMFADVEHILHAGDIGLPWVALELEKLAPVTAVLGNTDVGLSFKETEMIELSAQRFLVHHIVNPHAPVENLKKRINRDRPDVVVFGHTHKRLCETIDGVLYFNPGYAGKSRYGMERSVAILHCDAKGIRPEFLRL